MPTYRVILSGGNLLIDVDGEEGRYSFEVARFVEAASAEEAAERALALVRTSPQLARGVRNEPGEPPTCRVDAVQPLAPDEAAPAKQPGFRFYPEESDD
jgi:hypothetical protein